MILTDCFLEPPPLFVESENTIELKKKNFLKPACSLVFKLGHDEAGWEGRFSFANLFFFLFFFFFFSFFCFLKLLFQCLGARPVQECKKEKNIEFLVLLLNLSCCSLKIILLSKDQIRHNIAKVDKQDVTEIQFKSLTVRIVISSII
jgi:hypothetical protein